MKGNDLPLKPGPEDIPGDDNKDDDEMILQTSHCNDCDAVLYDQESMSHHLKRHQHLVKQTIGDLVENGLNGSVPSTEPIAEIRLAYDALKDIYLEDDTKPDEYSDLIKTEYEVSLFPMGKGLHSPFEISSENDDLLVIEGCKEAEAQQESAHPIQSEAHDDSSKVTSTITLLTREREHTQVSLVEAYFNGKEASVMVDTGSTFSTIRYDNPTQDRIFKIGKKRTCSQTC